MKKQVDPDTKKIIEFLYLKNHSNPEAIWKYVGMVGKSTFYKKLRLLIKEKIITNLPNNVMNGNYCLGNNKKDLFLCGATLITKPVGLSTYSKQWEKRKNEIIEKAKKKGFY